MWKYWFDLYLNYRKKIEGNWTENWEFEIAIMQEKLNKQWKCENKFGSFYKFITAEHSE